MQEKKSTAEKFVKSEEFRVRNYLPTNEPLMIGKSYPFLGHPKGPAQGMFAFSKLDSVCVGSSKPNFHEHTGRRDFKLHIVLTYPLGLCQEEHANLQDWKIQR